MSNPCRQQTNSLRIEQLAALFTRAGLEQFLYSMTYCSQIHTWRSCSQTLPCLCSAGGNLGRVIFGLRFPMASVVL